MVSLYLEKAATNDQNRCALFRPVTSHQAGWQRADTQAHSLLRDSAPVSGRPGRLVPAPLAVTRKKGRGHCSILGSPGGPASPVSAERDTSEVIIKY